MYKHVNRHGTYEISIAWEGRRGGSFANPLLVTTYVTISLSISQLFFRSPIFISAHDFTGVGIQFPGCCSYSDNVPDVVLHRYPACLWSLACTIAAHVVLPPILSFFHHSAIVSACARCLSLTNKCTLLFISSPTNFR